MARQDTVFFESEGNNWFQRNLSALTSEGICETDYPIQLLRQSGINPSKVLEVGCANGWRLGYLSQKFGFACTGVEPSEAAIRDGLARYPSVKFNRASATKLPFSENEKFDLVIVSYVLHWVSRESLLTAIAQIDSVIPDGGYLLLNDFRPDMPTKRLYHHWKDEDLYTFKQDYADIFLAAKTYEKLDSIVYNHDTLGKDEIDSANRAECFLLRKGLLKQY